MHMWTFLSNRHFLVVGLEERQTVITTFSNPVDIEIVFVSDHEAIV